MIRSYVSSDEDDYDDYDFGYSDPLIINKEKEPSLLPEVLNRQFREKLSSALEESKLIKLFLEAIDNGDLPALEELILLGVDVDSSAPHEWTPLMKACVMGRSEVVQFLLERGSNPNKQKELFTPLMACCTQTLVAEDLKLDCVRLLLEHGAEVNSKDKYGTTALMYAAGSGYEDIVAELLRVPGIDLNVQDREGWNALFYAVNQNKTNIIENLLSMGPDLTLRDRFERTAMTLALDREFKDTAKMLGYVEEAPPELPCPVKPLSCRFLDELPDAKGQGGFPSDAQSILAAFNQSKVKNISLPDLLNATDKDLYEIGVKLCPDRLRILSKGVHKFHLEPWKKTSMHQLVDGEPFSLENAIAITGSVAKHLTVVNATLKYLGTRISSRKNRELEDMSTAKDMIIILVDAYTVAEKLKVLLPKILQHARQIKPEVSPDYISPQVKENGRAKVKLFWWALGTAAGAAFLFRYCRTSQCVKADFDRRDNDVNGSMGTRRRTRTKK